jgi:RNA 2',3'-cyclic 3'-phosphodiesterase
LPVRLTASLLPPDNVLDDLAAALQDDLATTEQVAWEARSRWRIRLADFGTVVRADAVAVTECLAEWVAKVGRPTLRLEEIRPLPYDGDDSVWVGIGGDEDLLTELASAIPQWTHTIGFVPDRRAYRSGIRVGRVTATTTVSYLESLSERLGGYEGLTWTPQAMLMTIEKMSGPESPPRFEVFQELPLSSQPIERGGGVHVPASGSPS